MYNTQAVQYSNLLDRVNLPSLHNKILLSYAPIKINVMPAVEGGGRAWGGDLFVFVGPGVGHLTDLVLPGEGIFESFFARRGDI